MKVDKSNVYRIPNVYTICPECGKRRERYIFYNPFIHSHCKKDVCFKCKKLTEVVDNDNKNASPQ